MMLLIRHAAFHASVAIPFPHGAFYVMLGLMAAQANGYARLFFVWT
jgi:hypothetical protein